MPILDEDCYSIKDKGYLHISCHDGYKESTSKTRLDREYMKIYNTVYNTEETSSQEVILKKWKKHDTEKYSHKRMKEIKDEYEQTGPTGNMLNELLKTLSGHPNAIRIFIETTFKNMTYRSKGYKGMMANNGSPLLFDLMLMELVKSLINNDELIANKMLLTMYEVDKVKTADTLIAAMKARIYAPSKLYRNSMIYRIMEQAPIKNALEVVMALPTSLEWNPGVILSRFSELDYIAEQKGVMRLLTKYADSPVMWLWIGGFVFQSEEIQKNIEFVKLISLNTRKLVRSGRIYEYAENYPEIDWSGRIAGLIRGLSSSAYDAYDDIDLLRSQMSRLDLWDDNCSEALFEISNPEVFEVLRGNETIFDEL